MPTVPRRATSDGQRLLHTVRMPLALQGYQTRRHRTPYTGESSRTETTEAESPRSQIEGKGNKSSDHSTQQYPGHGNMIEDMSTQLEQAETNVENLCQIKSHIVKENVDRTVRRYEQAVKDHAARNLVITKLMQEAAAQVETSLKDMDEAKTSLIMVLAEQASLRKAEEKQALQIPRIEMAHQFMKLTQAGTISSESGGQAKRKKGECGHGQPSRQRKRMHTSNAYMPRASIESRHTSLFDVYRYREDGSVHRKILNRRSRVRQSTFRSKWSMTNSIRTCRTTRPSRQLHPRRQGNGGGGGPFSLRLYQFHRVDVSTHMQLHPILTFSSGLARRLVWSNMTLTIPGLWVTACDPPWRPTNVPTHMVLTFCLGLA